MKNTAARYYFITFIWTLASEAVYLLIFDPFEIIGLLPHDEDGRINVYIIVIASALGIYILYNLIQFVYYNSIKLTEIQDVKLGNYDIALSGLAGFTIHVNLNGEAKEAKTKHIFYRKTFGKSSMHR